MKNKFVILTALLSFLILIQFTSASHYIIGVVEDAKDGITANDHTIMLWNSAEGTDDNLTDIIGQNGNSQADNIYMIDCELLRKGCNISSTLTLKVINNGDNYVSEEINVTVTGAGYDVVNNITLNSPPNITYVNVDDELTNPNNEINLLPATTKEIVCIARVMDYEGENTLVSATGEFFDSISSMYSGEADNNKNYKNSSCIIDYSYGDLNEAEITCKFEVWYYANQENWNCTINVSDNLSISNINSDATLINPLLALGLDSLLNYNVVTSITEEAIFDVINYGNIKINLSLSGYAFQEGDGFAMNCSEGDIKEIPIYYEKFNLTNSNPGEINREDFENRYTNLTTEPKIKEFNLDYRENDLANDAINSTYWRIYVPNGINGNCQGNIVFGAVQAPGE